MATPPDRTFDVVVVGRGLMGSAAARHLADVGVSVALVGPGEPADPTAHDGVFGAHHDHSRITRIIDRHRFYARIAAASIARYRDVERRSGVTFFHDVGHLTVSPMSGYLDDLVANGRALGARLDVLDGGDIERRFPSLRFAAGMTGVLETGTGGWIDPGAFIEANGRLVEAAGGAVIDATVTELRPDGTVVTDVGPPIRGRRMLVATGAFANHGGLLPNPVRFEVEKHTTVHAELSDRQAQSLSGLPSIIYKRGDGPGQSVYLTPPGPGVPELKIGQSVGETMTDPTAELIPWYRSAGDPTVAAWLTDELRSMFPAVELGSKSTRSCVVTKSPTGHQLIQRLPGTELYTLLTGNGQVAKSADELGRIAAEFVRTGEYPPEYRNEHFTGPSAD